MINAERILATLDGFLDHQVSLILYGRAAIAMGFDSSPDAVKQSLDVDAITPLSETERLRADSQFWDAQEATNAALKKEGLYITHIFEAEQVFLRREWDQHLVAITRPQLRWLKLFRPATLDLILTKMMRGDDAQDMQDVAFLIQHDKITPEQIEDAFKTVVIPDMVEYRDAFKRAKPIVERLAHETSA